MKKNVTVKKNPKGVQFFMSKKSKNVDLKKLFFVVASIITTPITYCAYPEPMINRAYFHLCPLSSSGVVKALHAYIRTHTVPDRTPVYILDWQRGTLKSSV